MTFVKQDDNIWIETKTVEVRHDKEQYLRDKERLLAEVAELDKLIKELK